MIVVASADLAFARSLAEQVAKELAQPCEYAPSIAAARALAPSLIVSDEKDGHLSHPPIMTVHPPLRLAGLLADIRHYTETKETDALTPSMMLDRRRKQIIHNEKDLIIDLTDKEMQLLESLLAARGDGLSKEELLGRVWGIEAELNTHTLETHIYRLRSKLKEISGSEMIEAVEGGYKIA